MSQGTAGPVAAPCGTDGLAVCVGFAWANGNQWVIGHIDCDATVQQRPPNACATAVANWTQAQAAQLPAPQGAQAYIVTASNDFSSQSIITGLTAFLAAQGIQPHVVGNKTAFYIDVQNNFQTTNAALPNPQPVVGPTPFSVPRLNPPCP